MILVDRFTGAFGNYCNKTAKPGTWHPQMQIMPSFLFFFCSFYHIYNGRWSPTIFSLKDALLASIAESEKQTEMATRVSTWKQNIEHNLEEQVIQFNVTIPQFHFCCLYGMTDGYLFIFSGFEKFFFIFFVIGQTPAV